LKNWVKKNLKSAQKIKEKIPTKLIPQSFKKSLAKNPNFLQPSSQPIIKLNKLRIRLSSVKLEPQVQMESQRIIGALVSL